ncbi:hypothetical protein [Rossellomorea marisflavi]|uniref:hypothetical protein n=1 Tax=Rossellomorea marisflavi TaxID=189381 RepID=UPI003FA01A46
MTTITVKNELKNFLSLNEEEQVEKLFFSNEFLESYMNLNESYKDWMKEEVEKLESFQLSPLTHSTYNGVVMITPSARICGEWQRTIFQGGEPVSHCEYKSKDELLKYNVDDWFRQGLWIDEDNKKDLN